MGPNICSVMTQALAATVHAVREVFHELSTTTATVELIDKTLQALNRLVPSDTVVFDEVSLHDGQTRGATHPCGRVIEWADMMPLFEEWFFQSPNVQYFQAHPRGSAHRWSDGDLETFHASELYREFMAPDRHDVSDDGTPGPATLIRRILSPNDGACNTTIGVRPDRPTVGYSVPDTGESISNGMLRARPRLERWSPRPTTSHV